MLWMVASGMVAVLNAQQAGDALARNVERAVNVSKRP
jgi:hypothetical protein